MIQEIALKQNDKDTLVAIYYFVEAQASEEVGTPAPPTFRELMPMVGVVSTNTIRERVQRLARMGLCVQSEEINTRWATRLTNEGLRIAGNLYIIGDYTIDLQNI